VAGKIVAGGWIVYPATSHCLFNEIKKLIEAITINLGKSNPATSHQIPPTIFSSTNHRPLFFNPIKIR